MNRFIGERTFSPNDEGGRDANNFVCVSRGDIRNILESDDFSAVNFYAVEYTDSKGEKRPMYVT